MVVFLGVIFKRLGFLIGRVRKKNLWAASGGDDERDSGETGVSGYKIRLKFCNWDKTTTQLVSILISLRETCSTTGGSTVVGTIKKTIKFLPLYTGKLNTYDQLRHYPYLLSIDGASLRNTTLTEPKDDYYFVHCLLLLLLKALK